MISKRTRWLRGTRGKMSRFCGSGRAEDGFWAAGKPHLKKRGSQSRTAEDTARVAGIGREPFLEVGCSGGGAGWQGR